MKRIKQLFDALKTLNKVPDKAIADAWCALHNAVPTKDDPAMRDALDLVDAFMAAVIDLAEQDAKKGKAEAEGPKA